jgi:hypothetical protein
MNNAELAVIKEESRELNHMKPSRLEDSLFSKDLAPHYMKLAGQLAASEMVPKCFRNKPSDLFICWSMGYQIGIPPEQAMNCIAVVNGKAVMWGDEMLALCMSHPDFLDITEEPMIGKDNITTGYTCTIKRKGRTTTVSVFTLEMAKKAGLLAKGGVWNQYPDRMLKLRARGFALRDAFPDALKGIKSREEVEDYIDADYTVVHSKPSRTELLKHEVKAKKGIKNVEANDGSTTENEDKETRQETAESEEPPQMDEARETPIEPRSHIKQLIIETGFTEERLSKALKYYEVNSIDELSDESAQHFINRLTK